MEEGAHEGTGTEDPWVIMQPWCVSTRIRLGSDSSFKKWKYIFLLCRRSPEIGNLDWQLLGLQGLGLLVFSCSTAFKFASWCKMAAGASAIMSAFQGSGKKGKRTEGAHFSAGATSFKKHSKSFCTTRRTVITRPQLNYRGQGRRLGNVMFCLDSLPFHWSN